MKQTLENALPTWKSYLSMNETEIRQRFPMEEAHIQRDGFYGNQKGLTVLYDPDTYPGIFFLKNGQCLLFYASMDWETTDGLTYSNFIRLLGEPAADLPSRAGKLSSVYVFPEQGVAFSANGESVEFVEIFAPATLKDYQDRFYRKPGPFIR